MTRKVNFQSPYEGQQISYLSTEIFTEKNNQTERQVFNLLQKINEQK